MITYIGRQRHLQIPNGGNGFLNCVFFEVIVVRSPFGKVEIFASFIDMIFHCPRNRGNVGVSWIFGFVGMAIVAGVFQNRFDVIRCFVDINKIVLLDNSFVFSVHRNKLNRKKNDRCPKDYFFQLTRCSSKVKSQFSLISHI